MALGEMKISRADFWEMTIREFVCAWQGHVNGESEMLEAMQAIIFSGLRYNSTNTAAVMAGKKAANKIARHKFPWEKNPIKSDDPHEPLSYDDMKGLFNTISN